MVRASSQGACHRLSAERAQASFMPPYLLPTSLTFGPGRLVVWLHFSQRKFSDSRSALLNTLKGSQWKSVNKGWSHTLSAVCLQGEWAVWRGKPCGMDTDAALLHVAGGRSSRQLKSASIPPKHEKRGHLLLACSKITLSLYYLSNYFNSFFHRPPLLLRSPTVPLVVGGLEGR